MLEFKDQLVVITGAARGIGKAVAIEIAKRGGRVVILDVLEQALAENAKQMAAIGYTSSVQKLRENVVRDAGVPDIIYNNAFFAPHGSIFDAKINDLAKSFDVSVLGYIRIIQAFLPAMKSRKSGWIVNTASPIGVTPPALFGGDLLAYSIVKAGDIALSQSISLALQPFNIGVTVVYPYLVNTGALEEGKRPDNTEFVAKMDELFKGNAMEPEEFAIKILNEMQKGEFMATANPEFRSTLVAYARNGLDPRVEYTTEGHTFR